MISNDCKITEFFEAVQGKPVREAIDMACQEATEAERLQMSWRSKQDTLLKPACSNYPQVLKEFVQYIRFCAKPRITEKEKAMLFDSYLKSTLAVKYRD